MNEVLRLDAILRLQAEMLKLPQANLVTQHYFADGMYLRWLFRPAGTLIVGKVHKKEHFYLVIQGAVQIERDIYRAPTLIISQPGTKRAVLALEDSTCITIHRTDETELSKIESELVEPDESSPYGLGNTLKVIEQCPS